MNDRDKNNDSEKVKTRMSARKFIEQNENMETFKMEKDLEFKDQSGTPANVHAKKLAQAKSRKKAQQFPIFYTKKGLKVLKLVVKPGKTISTYIGNLSPKKHKADLELMIAKWTKDGIWLAEHEAKEKIAEIQAKFENQGE